MLFHPHSVVWQDIDSKHSVNVDTATSASLDWNNNQRRLSIWCPFAFFFPLRGRPLMSEWEIIL